MNIPPLIAIPEHLKQQYLALRILLYLSALGFVLYFVFRTLFPILEFSFDFKSPSSSKNDLFDPRSDTGTPRTNGKIETGGTLITDASALRDFARATLSATLEKKSDLPTALRFSLRRSYRSFLLPTGPAIGSFAKEPLYSVDGTYYALRDGTLHPFVSERAYLSRYPASFALPETADFLKRYPVSENWIGFRTGSLVSFADGIFVIVSDAEMRPIGSADVFLALGYRFEDVIPGSEEELGIYKRGRIFLLGATHPDGTLLLDTDTKGYFLVDHGFKRPIDDRSYLDFLLKQQSPITVSSQASERSVSCDMQPDFSGRTFFCSVPADMLTQGSGNDFELAISGADADIDINSLSFSLETLGSDQNMRTILSQIKQRLLTRFGARNQ